MIKKQDILMMMVAVLFVACASEDNVRGGSSDEKAISFASRTGLVSRSGLTGAEAADVLGNQFVVYGSKTTGSTEQAVFSGYAVDYAANTANTTESNSNDWEYVGKGSNQTIKYWDYSASKYTFAAYSLGKGDGAATPDKATATVESSNALLNKITLTGTTAQLIACSYTDKQAIEKGSYGNAVQLQFRNLAANVRLGLYETIPGYSVKEVKFYSSGDASPDTGAKLYSTAFDLPGADGGTCTITYDGTSGKAQIAYTQATASGSKLLSLGELEAATFADKQVDEAEGKVYLGRTSNASTISKYNKVLPNNQGTDLHLKVDYTLLSLDGSGQTIHVKGATAVVPAAYTGWKSSYAYTYLFKISDNTNGSTGSTTDPAGLYPITFDAWSKTDDEGQGTITTFGDYSITTYQEGSVDGESVGYNTNKPIDVTVIKGNGSASSKVALGDQSPKTDWVRIVLQSSSNESDVETTYPDGKEVTNITYSDGKATFTPTEEGFYRVEYWHDDNPGSNPSTAQKLAAKIVKVGTPKGDGSIKASKDEWDNNYRKVKRPMDR